ncbi:sensor histidine kinase [Bacteroidota bacterium]
MKNIVKPGSRLIILFILTLIISGGILTWLSINSISNFKELTEKKVREEQLSIVEQVSIIFQQNLEDVTGKFTAIVIKDNVIDLSEVKYCDTLDFVENPFILNKTAEFLWPWFLEDPKVGMEKLPSSAYHQDLQIAEKNEFRVQDYHTAVFYYKASLGHALGVSDSAKSMNALARVHLKLQDFDGAYFYYAYITSNYYSVLDNNGFPYVYYAVLNFLKSTDSENTSRIFTEIESFLSGLSSGKIPLNKSTSEILAQISKWIDISRTTGDNQIPELDEYIQDIDRNLRFIDNYSKIIKTSLEKGVSQEYPLMLGSYNVINEISSEPDKIILINPDLEYPSGFCVELDQIWSSTMKSNFCENTEFEYNMDLIDREENATHNADELYFTTEFSPFFPAFMVKVGLQDKNLVDIYVKRRSWTYGIALILLLGAMLLGILLILRDILREKRLSHLRSDFVSNVTHELKTPLTSIHLFAESVLLNRVDTASEKKEYLQIILNETERLKRIINNILDFSKKEEGKIEYKTEKVNVTNLISSALKDLNYWLVEKKFSVQTDLEENIIITADHDAFKQVVINLLDNAIKYSRDNKEILVKLLLDKDKIRIEFEDKGIGIPEDQLEAIFEKFYRVNKTMKDGVSGTGLGLTVVKEIIEAHNGEILVESKPNKGSKFTILLNPS